MTECAKETQHSFSLLSLHFGCEEESYQQLLSHSAGTGSDSTYFLPEWSLPPASESELNPAQVTAYCFCYLEDQPN